MFPPAAWWRQGLWMDSRDFMQGRYVLDGSRGIGPVVNAGSIDSVGSVGLAGSNVSNSGSIRALAGAVTLASGKRMTVDFAGDGLLRFAVSGVPDGAVIGHSGSIEATEVNLSAAAVDDVFSGVINTAGVIIAAKADGSGGKVSLLAAEITHDGEIVADGIAGGEVEMLAEHGLSVSGSISAKGIGLGVARTGGSVRLSADNVNVAPTALVDASGVDGGGEVLLGGGWQGADASISNADTTTVARGAVIKANAESVGDGGTVVVWADDTTRFSGKIEARGGAEDGAGGQAEVSGKRHLLMLGTADLRAANGKAGHLLLDPGTVRICDADAAGCANAPTIVDDPVTPNDESLYLDTFTDDFIEQQLALGDLSISTATAGTGNGVAEDINVDSAVAMTWASNTLTLIAGNNINLGGMLSTASGALSLSFGNTLSFGSASIDAATTITTAASGTQTINGANVNTNWAITGDGAGTISFADTTASFTGVEAIQGGTAVDAFVISGEYSGALRGGGGNDRFTFNSGADLTGVAGSVDGEAGSDTFVYAGGIAQSAIDGGDGADTLMSAVTGSATWSLSGNTVSIAGASFVLTNFEGLLGGSGADTFNVAAASIYDIDGGAGEVADIFNIDSSLTGDIAGGAGADVFNIRSSLSGGISGGGGGDTVNIYDGAAVTGSVTGGAGSDSLLYDSGITDPVAVSVTGSGTGGFSGSATDTGGFASMDILAGGAGSDSLSLDGGVLSTSGDTYSEDDETMTFSSFETLSNVGGTFRSSGAADTMWNIVNDVVSVGTVSVTGVTSLVGNAGADAFVVNSHDDSTVRISMDGAGGADVFAINADLVGNLDGGSGNNQFDISAPVTGNITIGSDGSNMISISATSSVSGSITGGTGSDQVFMADGATVGGGIDLGRGSTDVIIFAGDQGMDPVALSVALTAAVHMQGFSGTVELERDETAMPDSDETTMLASFSGVDLFIGGAGTLTGLDGGGAFNAVTLMEPDMDMMTMPSFATMETHSYGAMHDDNLVTLRFLGLENWQGGAGADSFVINGDTGGTWSGGGGADTFDINVAVTGAITGGAGADTFNVNAVAGGSVSGGADNDTFILGSGGSVTGGIIGGSGTDSLQGLDIASTWNVTGDGSGTVTATGLNQGYSGVENLVGGSAADRFELNAAHSGSITGGGGSNVYNLASVFSGGITGGAGSDTLNLASGGSISGGSYDGGAGTDTVASSVSKQ